MQLKKFIEIDPTYIELGLLDDGTCIKKALETHNAVYHKKCYDKIGQKEWNRRNHAVRLIRQVQQLSHTREQKLVLERSYAFFVETETQQKICVLQESFILAVVQIINISRINWILERDGSSKRWFGCTCKIMCWRCSFK